MGCDIHLHTEIKLDGKWEHYSAPSVMRHYGLFSKMAGVRARQGETPLVYPRGLPDDATTVTKLDCFYLGSDGHSHSWLNAVEISKLEEWAEQTIFKGNRWELESRTWGYLFGNSWGWWLNHSNEYPSDIQDIRFVFWFDN